MSTGPVISFGKTLAEEIMYVIVKSYSASLPVILIAYFKLSTNNVFDQKIVGLGLRAP